MMLSALMCVTFHPFSDGRRHSRPRPHVVENSILQHQGIVRSLFLYIYFYVEMFLKEMCMSESQYTRCSCARRQMGCS